MAQVQVPSEFCETQKITTEDISVLPSFAIGFRNRFQRLIDDAVNSVRGKKKKFP